jgi:predicted nucleotidyltransferase
MAKGVFESELSGDKVKLKKYFYALRPALAAMWITDASTVPPMDLERLRKQMSEDCNAVVDELLFLKAQVDESFVIERRSGLNDFIAESIHACEAQVPTASTPVESARLNELFKKYLV